MKCSNLPSFSCVALTSLALALIFYARIFSRLSSRFVFASLNIPSGWLIRRPQLIRGPETGRFTFEALLLLSLLSNFHKSDAAKLNPFLHHIGEITDVDVFRKVCWAAEFTAATTIK